MEHGGTMPHLSIPQQGHRWGGVQRPSLFQLHTLVLGRLPAVTFSGNNASALATLLDTELLSWGSFRCPLCALPLHPLPTVGLAPSPKPRGFSQGSRAFLKVHLFVCSFSSSVLAEDGLWCSASGSGATTDTNQTQACL